jgi:hypothetical protein
MFSFSAISCSVLLAVVARLAFAQTGTPVQGVVADDLTGKPVGGATVTFFTHQAVRYQAVTDVSGAFRIAMEPGAYEAILEKDGFVEYLRGPWQVNSAASLAAAGADAVRMRLTMQFGRTQGASLSGVVLDSKGKPLGFAHVDLVRGPGLWYSVNAEADGHFAFRDLNPGTFELRASPPENLSHESLAHDGQTADVATYFPSSIDAAGAQTIAVKGNAEVDGFQLVVAPVFRVRGVVRDGDSHGLVPQATVRLVPMMQQPEHVVMSFNSYFAVGGEGLGPGPDEARTVTKEDGSFEFPSVRAGVWSIVAEGAPLTEANAALAPFLTGVATVNVEMNGAPNVEVFLKSVFPLPGSASWTRSEMSEGVTGARLGFVQRVDDGVIFPFWLRAGDGRSGKVTLAMVQAGEHCSNPVPSCSVLRVDRVPGGQYAVQPLPAISNDSRLIYGRTGWMLGTKPVAAGQLVDLGRSSGPVSVSVGGLGVTNGVETSNTGSVHGVVENGAGAAVVLLSEGYPRGDLGVLVFCGADGTFEAGGLVPSTYRAAAFRGLDFERLRDPKLLQQVLSGETKVEVKVDRVSEVKLKSSNWPE